MDKVAGNAVGKTLGGIAARDLSDKGPCSQFDYNVVECTHKIPPPPLEGHVERPFPPPMCIDHLVSR